MLRAQLNNAGLQHVKIVAADGAFEPISTDINKNPTLKAAVDYIGYGQLLTPLLLNELGLGTKKTCLPGF